MPERAARTPVYICAPYNARKDVGMPPEIQIKANCQRAEALAVLAIASGLAPILPHAHNFAYIRAGRALVMQDMARIPPQVTTAMPYAEVVQREHAAIERMAMECSVAQVRAVRKARGYLWILERDDGTLSNGCAEELAVFEEECETAAITRMKWGGWTDMMRTQGLLAFVGSGA